MHSDRHSILFLLTAFLTTLAFAIFIWSNQPSVRIADLLSVEGAGEVLGMTIVHFGAAAVIPTIVWACFSFRWNRAFLPLTFLTVGLALIAYLVVTGQNAQWAKLLDQAGSFPAIRAHEQAIVRRAVAECIYQQSQDKAGSRVPPKLIGGFCRCYVLGRTTWAPGEPIIAHDTGLVPAAEAEVRATFAECLSVAR